MKPINLTLEQQAVVDHPAEGTLVVSAAPGTGKSLCLAFRAARLARQGSVLVVASEQLLGAQLRERFVRYAGLEPGEVTVTTPWELAREHVPNPDRVWHSDRDVGSAVAEHLGAVLGPLPAMKTPGVLLAGVRQALTGADALLGSILQLGAEPLREVVGGLGDWFEATGPLSGSVAQALLVRTIADGGGPDVDYVLIDGAASIDARLVRALGAAAHIGLTVAVDPSQALQDSEGVEDALRRALPDAFWLTLPLTFRDVGLRPILNPPVHRTTPRPVSVARAATQGEVGPQVASFLDDLLGVERGRPSPGAVVLTASRAETRWLRELVDGWMEEHWHETEQIDVQVLPVERAKGLEWDRVLLVLSGTATENQRHVGVTRAVVSARVVLVGMPDPPLLQLLAEMGVEVPP